jgi:transcriptional regulator with XRE-family HTH domain
MRYKSLADYLERSGVNQADLARALGVAQSLISRWASGASVPRPKRALQIAKHCGFPVSSFQQAYLARRARRPARRAS